ncbi:MAG TPA: tetratricopeptide repeat protein [Elusimicrobiota bacterium]|nr:tetratricopeptide repeat protein [Elusimicrobiota bacterium]
MTNRGRYDYAWACQTSQFADILIGTSRHCAAEDLYRQCLESAGKIGAARSVRSKLLWGLARVNNTIGRKEKALDFIHQARALRDEPFGDDHAYEIQSLHENGATLIDLDRLDEAAEILCLLSAMARRRPFNTRVIMGHTLLGRVRARQGRHDEAEQLFNRALSLKEKIIYQAPIYEALYAMVKLLIETGRLQEAEKMLLDFRNDPRIAPLTVLARTQQNPNPSGLVHILRLLFEVAARQGEFPAVLAYGAQAVREARAQHDAQQYDSSFSDLQRIAEASIK